MIQKALRLFDLRRLLIPLALLYGIIIRCRNVFYDRSPSASHSAGIPVISVGNITVGGTGKTPIVMEISRVLLDLGRKPAILTRGYGAAKSEIADEVREYSQALPGVPVIVNPDRIAGAERARKDYAADCLVLDDGFQHRRLRRDLEVMVIDALDPWGGGWLLPAGRLREPLSALRRVDLFILSRANQVEPGVIRLVEQTLTKKAPEAEIVWATLTPEKVVFLNERTEGVGILGYHNLLPVCGIGNPRTFLHSINALAGRVCGCMRFRDHQRYGQRQVRKIVQEAQRRGADLVVTTRKDWVKLAPAWTKYASERAPELARLDVRLFVQDPDGILDQLLRQFLENSV